MEENNNKKKKIIDDKEKYIHYLFIYRLSPHKFEKSKSPKIKRNKQKYNK